MCECTARSVVCALWRYMGMIGATGNGLLFVQCLSAVAPLAYHLLAANDEDAVSVGVGHLAA